MLLPLNVIQLHWVLAVFDLRSWTITVFDSLGSDFEQHWRLILRNVLIDLPVVLQAEGYWQKKQQLPMIELPNNIVRAPRVPRQASGDCGVWVCWFIQQLCRDAPLDIDISASEFGIRYRRQMAQIFWSIRQPID